MKKSTAQVSQEIVDQFIGQKVDLTRHTYRDDGGKEVTRIVPTPKWDDPVITALDDRAKAEGLGLLTVTEGQPFLWIGQATACHPNLLAEISKAPDGNYRITKLSILVP